MIAAIPPIVLELAGEARRFGARVLVRECGQGSGHVDVFDAPDSLTVRRWDAGYRARERGWYWCASLAHADGERITDRPAP